MKIIYEILTKNESNLIELNDEGFSLLNLEAVACIRFALTHVCEFLVTNFEKVFQEETLFSLVERLCKRSDINSDTAGPRMFLLKVLYRRCGEVGIQKLLSQSSFNWILPQRIRDTKAVRLTACMALVNLFCWPPLVSSCMGLLLIVWHRLLSDKTAGY